MVAAKAVDVAEYLQVDKRPFRGRQEGSMSEAGMAGFGQGRTKAARHSDYGQRRLPAVAQASNAMTEEAFRGLAHPAAAENISMQRGVRQVHSSPI